MLVPSWLCCRGRGKSLRACWLYLKNGSGKVRIKIKQLYTFVYISHSDFTKYRFKAFEDDVVSKQSMVLARCNRVNDLITKGYFTYCAVVVNFYIISPLIQSTLRYLQHKQNNNTEPIELITQMEQELVRRYEMELVVK